MDHEIWISNFALTNLCLLEGTLCIQNATAEIIIAVTLVSSDCIPPYWLPLCCLKVQLPAFLHFQCLSQPLAKPSLLNIEMKLPLLNGWFSFYCCLIKNTFSYEHLYALLLIPFMLQEIPCESASVLEHFKTHLPQCPQRFVQTR